MPSAKKNIAKKNLSVITPPTPKSKRPPTIHSVKGVYEILPSEAPFWERTETVIKNTARFYNFKRLETGLIESADLFIRTAGADSDIVNKELFTVRSGRTDKWVLRPEGTAPMARAYLEYGLSSLPQPVKLFSIGPMFRYENPQAGRYRQFHQSGFEIIGGDSDPVFDAECIQIAARILRDVGLGNFVIHINSIGTPAERVKIKKVLLNHFRSHLKNLPPELEAKIKLNPLRVLDSKDARLAELKKDAPLVLDSLNSSSRQFFKHVLEYLDELNLPYELNNSLVRGLDYYNHTVFEFILPDIEGKPGLALGAGGRYDGLVEFIGGRKTSAVGFALGLERIIAALKDKKGELPNRFRNRVFFIHVGEVAKKKSLLMIESLRDGGVAVLESIAKDSLGKQLKLAEKEGVEYVLILGQREVYEESIIIKNLKTGIQEVVPVTKMVEQVKKRLSGQKPISRRK